MPRVNINGNRREELVDQLCNASDALLDALHALQACEYSNGRNFQSIRTHRPRHKRVNSTVNGIERCSNFKRRS